MKMNILTPLAAIAAFTFTLASCTTSDNLDNAVTSVTPETVAQPGVEDFQTQYEAETRSAGMATADAAMYENMFSDVGNTADYNFMALARKNSELSTFTQLMRDANMISMIELTGQRFTILAPTNAAFAAMPAGELERLRKPQNRSQLVELLQAHMIAQPIELNAFEHNQQVQFGDNKYIPVKVSEEGHRQVKIGGATIVKPNVMASNGIIHVVDAVVQPVGFNEVTE